MIDLLLLISLILYTVQYKKMKKNLISLEEQVYYLTDHLDEAKQCEEKI